jgi:hypothetical protein
MTEMEIAQNGKGEPDKDLPGIKLVSSTIQERSTRDLEKCVKADLRNRIDPDVLDRLRTKHDAPQN